MSDAFVAFPYQATLKCGIGDLAHHEDGVRISLYDREEERAVDGEIQRDARFFYLVLRFCSFLRHLKQNLVHHLKRDKAVLATHTCTASGFYYYVTG